MLLEDLLLFILFVAGRFLFLWILKRAGKLESAEEAEEPSAPAEVHPGVHEERRSWGFALSGPFLMWKTRRGRQLLDRLATRRRFWRAFGDGSIVLVFLAMVSMTALLVYLAALVVNVPADRAPGPTQLLGLPGLNPLIPLWYGI